MERCKTCKHWRHYQDYGKEWHECQRVDLTFRPYEHEGNNNATVYADALDDSGLQSGFVTGPEFGCTLWEKAEGK